MTQNNQNKHKGEESKTTGINEKRKKELKKKPIPPESGKVGKAEKNQEAEPKKLMCTGNCDPE